MALSVLTDLEGRPDAPLGRVAQAQGHAYLGLGHKEAGLQACERAVLLDPTLENARTTAMFLRDPEPWFDSVAARQAWWEHHGKPYYIQRLSHSNRPDHDRVLRVGYVSGDFKFHSASRIFTPVVLSHSDQFKVYGYSTLVPAQKSLTAENFRDELIWREVHNMTPMTLARTIQEDKIDILVDLSGYTRGHRLETFCATPAPVQVTAWGYALPTELPVFDAFFADPVYMPKWSRTGVNPVVDLPCVVAYEPPPAMVAPEVLPDRPPVFGSFNRPLKLDNNVLHAWREILRRLPNSTLILKHNDYVGDIREWMVRELGDVVERVEFRGSTTHRKHMLAYQDIDLALDPFLHSGGVTMLEGLWMGVPTVTLPGLKPFSRLSQSVLSVLNLHDFIARNQQDYEDKAVEWVTTRRQELSNLRQSLRGTLQASPIMVGYVEAVESAYRTLWHAWCQKEHGK